MSHVPPGTYTSGGYSHDQYSHDQYSQPYGAGQGVHVPPNFGHPGPDGTVPLDQPWYGIGFKDATLRYFKKYARFNGFASRGEFWWAYLGVSLIFMVIPFLFIILAVILMVVTADPVTGEPGSFAIVFSVLGYGLLILASLAIMIPQAAIMIRRLHDAGYSGWMVLLSFVPVGNLVVLVFMFMPTNQANWKPDWFDN